jgi:Domain of unknown function (DUF6883)
LDDTINPVSLPPRIGEVLPNVGDAYGIEKKLASYSLRLEHARGATKAQGFVRVLAITLDDLDYLADALRQGVLKAPVSAVRDRPDQRVVCEVVVEVGGLGDQSDRVATVLTSWHLRWDGDAPRLVTALH